MTITLAAWWVPTLITVAGIAWALFWVDDGGGFLSGLDNLMALIPALAVSLVAWIVYAVLK